MAEIQERTTPDAELAGLMHDQVRAEENFLEAQAQFEAAKAQFETTANALNEYLQGLAAHYKTPISPVLKEMFGEDLPHNGGPAYDGFDG